ncbi:ribosome maturation factor RimM [Spongiibacter marinus]|uniref:ribosome maturation factor RimM n=1 Tax=Spongiibacter marinus TaxID=354246 RepID=UPI0035BE6E6A
MSTSSSPVVIAKISTVYGVKGWVKIHSFTDPLENFLDFSDLRLRQKGQWQKIELDECRRHGKGIVAHIKGVDDREVAREYCGLELGILAEQLPSLAENEFYWHQLVGLKVIASGQLLGVVDHMIETGANDVMVVRRCEGSLDDRERLIPYLPGDFVQDIDLQSGTITVDWDPEF